METVVASIGIFPFHVAVFVSQTGACRPFTRCDKVGKIGCGHLCTVFEVGVNVGCRTGVIYEGKAVVVTEDVFQAAFQLVVFPEWTYIVNLECVLAEVFTAVEIVPSIGNGHIHSIAVFLPAGVMPSCGSQHIGQSQYFSVKMCLVLIVEASAEIQVSVFWRIRSAVVLIDKTAVFVPAFVCPMGIVVHRISESGCRRTQEVERVNFVTGTDVADVYIVFCRAVLAGKRPFAALYVVIGRLRAALALLCALIVFIVADGSRELPCFRGQVSPRTH